MKALHIQVQPGRAPGLEEAVARDLLRDVGAGTGVVARVDVTEGYDNGRYLNIDYVTDDLPRLWSLLKKVLQDPTTGPLLARSLIVVCQGEAGWDDYLLLHHFDPSEPLDRLPEEPPAGT
jgi:hypothetical protein